MKKINRILAAACLSVTTMFLTVSADFIDKVKQDNINRQIVITGSLPAGEAGESITVAVLPEEKLQKSNLAFEDFSYLKQIVSQSDGTYQLSYGTDAPSGRYVVRVYGNGAAVPAEASFTFYAFREADGYLPALNAADAAAIKNLAETQKALLGISSELYDLMLSKKYNLTSFYTKLAAHTNFGTIPEFISYFNELLRSTAVTVGDSEVVQALVAGNGELFQGMKAQSLYKAFSSTGLALTYEKMSRKSAANDADIKRIFAQSVLLSYIKLSDWQSIQTVLQNGPDGVIGLNLTNFNQYPAAVSKKIAGENYPDIPALQTAMDQVTNTPEGSGGTGGGGGGGGGTVTASYTGQVEETGVKQPEIKGFTDLDGYDWAKSSILSLYDKGIVNGDGENHFLPENPITREEFVAILMRAFPMESSTGTADFADVPANAWYQPYLAAAQKSGITKGIGQGFFGVGRDITRQEIAAMAYQTLGKVYLLEEPASSIDFADAEAIGTYARKAVSYLSEAGILNGFEDGTFRPEESATRAQVAKIIYQMLRYDGGVK